MKTPPKNFRLYNFETHPYIDHISSFDWYIACILVPQTVEFCWWRATYRKKWAGSYLVSGIVRLRYTQPIQNYSKLKGCTSTSLSDWNFLSYHDRKVAGLASHRSPWENTRDHGTLPQNLLIADLRDWLIPRFIAIEYQCKNVQRQQSFVFK